MFIKTKEYKQSDNDIYFIQIISDKIIINDSYDGILLLDGNLDLIKRLKIFDGITIYSSFINNIDEEILLFCPDNECMVHINLQKYEYKVIHLQNGFEDLIFSNLYEWNINGLALSTYKGEFYSVSIAEKIIRPIDYKEVQRKYTELYNLIQEIPKNNICKMFPDVNVVLMYDEDRNIKMFNDKEKIKHAINNANIGFLDIDFREGTFAMVNENVIEIIVGDDTTMIYPDEKNIFLQGRLISKYNDIYLIVLSSSKSDASYSKVDMFKL